jgi:hypothetical protein
MAPPEDNAEMEEKEEAYWAAKPMKVPGEDGMPVLVW